MDVTKKLDPDKFYEKVKELSKKFDVSENEVEEQLLNHAGPKKLQKMGLFENEGWRSGFTKPSLSKRKRERRKKKKKK